jgi:hypothetical protein
MCFASTPEEEEKLRAYWADLPNGKKGTAGVIYKRGFRDKKPKNRTKK